MKKLSLLLLCVVILSCKKLGVSETSSTADSAMRHSNQTIAVTTDSTGYTEPVEEYVPQQYSLLFLKPAKLNRTGAISFVLGI